MRSAPGTKLYDLFKLIVALILLLILILLLQRPAPPSPQPPTQTPVATATQPVSTETPEPVPTQATQVELPPLPDSPEALTYNPETRTLGTSDGLPVYQLDEGTGDWVPFIPDELSNTLETGSALRPLTDGWAIETQEGEVVYLWDPETLSWKEAKSEIAEAQTAPAPESEMDIDCPLAKPSRLVAGIKGRVTSPLNIRSSPGIAYNRLFTMSPGTELTILGNPICLPHHKGAYLWWQVEIPGVQVGWSAEAPQNEDFYFIDPIE